MLPRSIQDWYVNLIAPVIKFLVKHRVHPNFLTSIGLLIAIFAAYFLYVGNFTAAGWIILVGGTFDTIDGKVARETGLSSKFGAFYDATLDRFSEIVVYLGMLGFYISNGDWLMAYVILVASGGALMVSYTRAKAETLGIVCNVGIFTRQARVVYLGFGAIAGQTIFYYMVWFLAVASNLTAIQRIFYVYSTSRGVPLDEK